MQTNSNVAFATTDDTMSFQSALGRAIAMWSQGKRIPMTIAAELIELGYDVPSLERRHLKRG